MLVSLHSSKARSTPATMSKQHCRMLQVERCFDIVAVFGNNVERNFVLSTKSKQTEHVQFVSTLSKVRNFTKTPFNIVKNGNNVEATFDFVEATFDFVALAFDNVASTLLLVWTGFKLNKPSRCSAAGWHYPPARQSAP